MNKQFKTIKQFVDIPKWTIWELNAFQMYKFWDIEIGREIAAFLTEYFEEVKEVKGLWKHNWITPYYTIHSCWDVVSHNNTNNKCIESLNCFQTKKQAESVVNLKKHIYEILEKYGRIEVGDNYIIISCDYSSIKLDITWTIGFEEKETRLIFSWDVMHKYSTSQEIEKRIELLKAVNETYKELLNYE